MACIPGSQGSWGRNLSDGYQARIGEMVGTRATTPGNLLGK